MNTLLRHIEYLISRKDCVIIPELGALLANNVSALYSVDTHLITPPIRVFTFNGDLRHNDGLLVTSIQRAEGISYEAALRKVQSGVEAMLTQLRQTGELRLGNIGVIRRNGPDGLLTFEGIECDRYNTEYLWLSELQLEPLVQEETGTVIEAPIQKRRSNTFRRITRIAASIAVVLGIGFVASTPILMDDAMLASLAPDVHKVEAADLVPERDDAPTLEIVLPTPTEDSIIKADRPVKGKDTYYVVIASVATESEAELFMSYHPELKLGYYDMGKYYVIYSAEYDNVMDAYRASVKASETYPEAWVCKK